jgi:hypothetical protein
MIQQTFATGCVKLVQLLLNLRYVDTCALVVDVSVSSTAVGVINHVLLLSTIDD